MVCSSCVSEHFVVSEASLDPGHDCDVVVGVEVCGCGHAVDFCGRGVALSDFDYGGYGNFKPGGVSCTPFRLKVGCARFALRLCDLPVAPLAQPGYRLGGVRARGWSWCWWGWVF